MGYYSTRVVNNPFENCYYGSDSSSLAREFLGEWTTPHAASKYLPRMSRKGFGFTGRAEDSLAKGHQELDDNVLV